MRVRTLLLEQGTRQEGGLLQRGTTKARRTDTSYVSPSADAASQTYVGAVDAPLEAGFRGSVCLTCQNFVLGFIGPVFGQAADDGLACSRGLELEFFTTVGPGEPRW